MRIVTKALVFLTVMLIVFSNGFSTLPAAKAASSFYNPSTEFGSGSYLPYLNGKGYWGTRYWNSEQEQAFDFTVGGSTRVWNQNGQEERFENLDDPKVEFVSVKYNDTHYLYQMQGGYAQVVPASADPVFDITVTWSSGNPRIQVNQHAKQKCPVSIENVSVFFSGTAMPGRITLMKCYDGIGGEPGKPITFTVTGPGRDGPSRTVTVKACDLGGETIKVPYGTYYIKETVPDGYRFVDFCALPQIGSAMDTPDTISVIVGDPTCDAKCIFPTAYLVTCKNMRVASIDLAKSVDGAQSGDTTGFSFSITKVGSTSFNRQVTLQNGAHEKIDGLEPGIYKITETADDPDYRFLGFSAGIPVVGEKAVLVTVGLECWNASVTCNNRKLGRLEIVKTDSKTGGPVANVAFDVSGPGYNGTLTTGTDGKASLYRLTPSDSYTVTEISAPDGYRINNPNPVTKTIPAGGTATFSFSDDPTGWVLIKKVDRDNPERLLDNAVFQIADNAGFSNAITLPKTVNGVVKSPALLTGHWWIKEIAPPEGYALDPVPANNIKEVDVSLNSTTAVTFTNVMNVGSLRVRKLSTVQAAPLESVTFELMDLDPADSGFTLANIIRSGKTDANGELLFGNLAAGTAYWVRETASIAGYCFDAGLAKSATIAFDHIAEIVFENSPAGFVSLTKIDSKDAGKKLKGAVYGIFKDAGCEVLAETMEATGADGITLSAELPFGPGCPEAYYIREIAPPAGYLLSDEIVKVAFTKPGQTVPIIVADRSNKGSIIIKKIDSLKPTVVLVEAEFTLFKLSAPVAAAQATPVMTMLTEVAKGQTGQNGLLRFDGLEPGTYWVKETKAPEGYLLKSDLIKAVVTAGETEPDPLILTNTYDPDPVPTGMTDWNILLIGCAALLGGTGLLLCTRKRKGKTVK